MRTPSSRPAALGLLLSSALLPAAVSGPALAFAPANAPRATAPTSPASPSQPSAPGLATSPLRHELYELPNGLKVILHVDNTLPIATINLWYRVGARNEPKGRSGFAHLFEHLMFMGTKRVPGSDFDKLMEAGGGANNASTSLDRTNYFSSGPSHILPLLLWLDADRLEDVGATMTKEKLDLQRDVVRNEIRQNVENSPYGRAYELSYKLMYPETHPYHKGVYGTHEDLEAATVFDVKDFFSTFYAPENCSLVVAGAFDPAAIKPLIQTMFGTLPRGNAAPQATDVPDAALRSVVRATLLDKVQLPRLDLLYHAPGSYKPGDAEISLFNLSLAEGKSSSLYQRLVVKDQLAVDVSASTDSAALGSIVRINITAKPGADLARIEQIADEEIAKLVASGPSEDELARRKTQVELLTLSSLQSVQRRADVLNEYLYYFGKPDALAEDLGRYRTATVAGIKSWSAKVFTPGARAVIRTIPDSPAPATTPRQSRPADLARADFVPPLPTITPQPSGVKLWHYQRSGVPMFSMSIVCHTTLPIDTADRAGRCSLLAELLQEGTADMTAEQLAQTLQALGGTLSTSGSMEAITITVEGLSKNAEKLADIAFKVARSPKLDSADFDRLKALRLDALAQQADEPQVVAPRLAAKMLWSDANPYGTSQFGTLKTIESLQRTDLQSAAASLLSPKLCTVILAGDLDPATASKLLQKATAGWEPASPATAPQPADYSARTATGLRFFIVDRPSAVQTVFSFMAPGPKVSAAERIDLELANIVLGGSFTSRLNNNLREVHGFTYGARSRVSSTQHLGSVSASTAVKADVTGPALAEFLGELRRISSGDISEGELTKARETFAQGASERFGTLRGVTGEAASLLLDGLAPEALAQDLAKAKAASVANVNAAAAKHFDLDRGVLVLVGDAALIQAQLKDLMAKLRVPEPQLVDAEGKPVTAKTGG